MCFRGNPDQCDYLGNSALHLASRNGHMNTATYLVSMGCNLWALDNDFHTPLDVAGLNNRTTIVKYLDKICAIQSERNRKIVKKFKERAVLNAQKRIKRYNKLQAKAQRKAAKEDKLLAEAREKMLYDASPHSAPASVYSTIKSDHISQMSYNSNKTAYSEPKPYSAHFTINSAAGKRLLGGNVAKKIREKRENGTLHADFKVREFEMNGSQTLRSLSGLKRDSHILYANKNKSTHINTLSSKSIKSAHMDDVVYTINAKNASDGISRAISEPDFANINDDSGIESGDSNLHDSAGIFERPGFGTVSFMNRPHTSGALMSLPWDNQLEISDDGQGKVVVTEKDTNHTVVNGASSTKAKLRSKSMSKGVSNFRRKGSVTDSIGTLGSLAVRIRDVPWDESDVDLLDDDDIVESTPLELFFTSNGLTEFLSNFTKEKIDLKAATLLSDADLKELGLPLGPRRKFMEAIGRRKSAMKNPGIIYDTRL